MRISDWSSDVCSSDLSLGRQIFGKILGRLLEARGELGILLIDQILVDRDLGLLRGLNLQFFVDQVAEHLLAQPLLFLGAELQVRVRSEEHTSELQSLMRISYAVFCLKKKKKNQEKKHHH